MIARRLRSSGLLVLLLGGGLSGWLAKSEWAEIETRSAARFQRETAAYVEQVDARFRELNTLLRATVGYFSGSESVTPQEFTRYAQELDLRVQQPGIQGMGYAVWLPQSGRAALERAMHEAGETGFSVWPDCGGAAFSSIVGLEPQDWRNRRARGYDMFCEARRRAAMQRAARVAFPVLSEPVTLVQESTAAQQGVLLYAGIPGRDATPRTDKLRLQGWAYLPIRIKDLIAALDTQASSRAGFALTLTDITDPAHPVALYLPRTLTDGVSYAHASERLFNGRRWRFAFVATPAFVAGISYAGVYYAFISGLGVSLLLAGSFEWLARRRRSAEVLARRMTVDLHEREAELETLFDASPDGTLVVAPSGHIVRANAEVARMFGTALAALIGSSVDTLIPASLRGSHQAHREHYARAPQTRSMGGNLALSALRADGSTFPVDVMLAPLTLERVPHTLVVVRDITRRRELEAAQTAMLAEKTLLLQEVHHRVKNNLQVIYSMIDLQKESLTDTPARDVLTDAQTRVRAMALIHQVLYQSKVFGDVDLADYMRALLRDLSTSHGRPEIVVETDTEPVRMKLERAIPCGLLLNEAVSNAFKHAFPAQRPGRIVLALKKTAGGAEMSVTDDGVGLPSDWASRDSLGMRLIALLAEQCEAQLTIASIAGTRIVLHWQD